MSLTVDIFKIGTEVVGSLLKLDRTHRFEVSEHFANLSRVFKAYPSAHRSNDADQVAFLVGKTNGLIEALKGTAVFVDVLGKKNEGVFFNAVGRVLTMKVLMSKDNYPEKVAAYSEIMAIAGYFEGYAEALKAQSGK